MKNINLSILMGLRYFCHLMTAMQDQIKSIVKPTENKGSGGNKLPLAGPLTADDIGQAVVFFASDCAKNITGQALNVDCGYLMN